MLHVLSTSTLASIATISVPDNARDVVFIRNGTVMIVCTAMPTGLAFYDVNSPTSYTFTFKMNASGVPSTIYRVNDTLLYISISASNTAIQTLNYSASSDTWTWGSLPATRSTSFTVNFQSAVDACGRIWVSTFGYGIRIFDSTGTTLLHQWPLSIGLSGIVITENFDLYAADYIGSKIRVYRPDMDHCTS